MLGKGSSCDKLSNTAHVCKNDKRCVAPIKEKPVPPVSKNFTPALNCSGSQCNISIDSLKISKYFSTPVPVIVSLTFVFGIFVSIGAIIAMYCYQQRKKKKKHERSMREPIYPGNLCKIPSKFKAFFPCRFCFHVQ